MCSTELNGIYIHPHPQNPVSTIKDGSPPEGNNDKSSAASSGIGSNSSSITSNNNSATIARKRNLSPDARDFSCDTQLDEYEMEKLRRIMGHGDGDRRGSVSSSHRGSIEPSLMSTVFAVVLVIIVSITVYAFTSLYKAVVKRMNDA